MLKTVKSLWSVCSY